MFLCVSLFRDLRDIGAKKISVHSLNKVVVDNGVVLFTCKQLCTSFTMVRSVVREMAVLRKASSLPPTHR